MICYYVSLLCIKLWHVCMYCSCKGVSDLKACLDYSFRKFEFFLPIVSNDLLLRKIKQPLKKGLGRKTKIQFSQHDDMNNPASKSNSLLLMYREDHQLYWFSKHARVTI